MEETEERKRIISLGFKRLILADRDTIYVDVGFHRIEPYTTEELSIELSAYSQFPFEYRDISGSDNRVFKGQVVEFPLKEEEWHSRFRCFNDGLVSLNNGILDYSRLTFEGIFAHTLTEGLAVPKPKRDIIWSLISSSP